MLCTVHPQPITCNFLYEWCWYHCNNTYAINILTYNHCICLDYGVWCCAFVASDNACTATCCYYRSPYISHVTVVLYVIATGSCFINSIIKLHCKLTNQIIVANLEVCSNDITISSLYNNNYYNNSSHPVIRLVVARCCSAATSRGAANMPA